MKTKLLSLFMLGLALPSFGVEQDYVDRAMLTEEQEKEVIALAQECGIGKVSRISSYNMVPTPFRGITVQGVEQVKGREVSCQVLNVSYGKWLEPGARPQKGQAQRGDFWAGKPHTRKKIILRVSKKEYRIGSLQGMTAEECETILGLFLNGEYKQEPAANGRMLSQVDWSKPISFSRRGESISAGFLHKTKDAGFFDLQIKLAGKKLTIHQMFQAIP